MSTGSDNTPVGIYCIRYVTFFINLSLSQVWNIIDWANYHIASKSFTSTALSRARACISFNNQWYTDAQAHKFNKDLSLTCRCCQSNKSETIAHVIGCPSRAQTHNEYRPQVTAHFRSCRIGNHLPKALELGINVVLSFSQYVGLL